jgi:RNA polymerase sigma factor (sigma-70 family)
MSQTQGTGLLRHIRRLATAGNHDQPDSDLVRRFLVERDEAAFAALVQRHGGMVLGVCRGVLQHAQDAEDAFQATFLVLARKAHTIRKQQSLGSWLHGVAYRLALKARSAARREVCAKSPEDIPAPSNADDLTLRELRSILHEELHRLPEYYRAPLLLCYWEGKTRDEAAAQLGVTPDAFKKHLERARNLLGSRLVGRGLAPSAALMAALLSADGVRAALSTSLTQSTARAATAFAVGKGASSGASAAAVALAEGAIRTMTITKWASLLVALFLTSGFGAALSFGAYQAFQGDRPAGVVEVDVLGQRHLELVKAKTPAGKKSDKERFVGTWKIKTGLFNGEQVPIAEAGLIRLTFHADGTYGVNVIEETKEDGKYVVSDGGKIDLRKLNDAEDQLGIYKFEGNDVLVLCVTSRGKDKEMRRPTELSGEKGTNQTLMTLVRAKPGEEKVNAKDLEKLKGGVDKVREAAARAQSANHLKQIGLAMHNFHDANKAFPAHAIYDKDGKKPLLSWRVAILPYIEQSELYKEFKLDEPWDSEHNKKLIKKMPAIYEIPLPGKKKEGHTHYQVFTGPDTIFDGPNKMKVVGITDGTSNTILAVEAKNAVEWTRPDDLTLPKDKDKLPAVGGHFSNGFHVLIADGSVRLVSPKVSPEAFRAAITPAGGEIFDLDKQDK